MKQCSVWGQKRSLNISQPNWVNFSISSDREGITYHCGTVRLHQLKLLGKHKLGAHRAMTEPLVIIASLAQLQQKYPCGNQDEYQNLILWYEQYMQNTIFPPPPSAITVCLHSEKGLTKEEDMLCKFFSSVILHFMSLTKCTFSIAFHYDRHQILSEGCGRMNLACCKQVMHPHLHDMVLRLSRLWVSMLVEGEDTVWSLDFKTSMFYA